MGLTGGVGGAWDPCSSTSHSHSQLAGEEGQASCGISQKLSFSSVSSPPHWRCDPLLLFIGDPSQTVVALAGCHKKVGLSEVR